MASNRRSRLVPLPAQHMSGPSQPSVATSPWRPLSAGTAGTDTIIVAEMPPQVADQLRQHPACPFSPIIHSSMPNRPCLSRWVIQV